ncbi:MAG: hypothetical protein Q8S73_36755 [Deltaproteobacteria bacterium]|nr:hypothetical protein [Deltaproteobacteria bacterium]
MKTLTERLRWLLAERGVNQRDLGEKAGLSKSFTGVYFNRAKKDPTAGIGADEAAALAARWKVSMRWLVTGEGSPDALDADEPSRTESSEPIAENIPGYADVEAADRQAHTGIDEAHWLAARKAAAYVIHGPAAPGDALKLARLAQEFADPERVRRAFAEQEARLAAMRDEMERERLEFQRQVAELKAGKRPKKPPAGK